MKTIKASLFFAICFLITACRSPQPGQSALLFQPKAYLGPARGVKIECAVLNPGPGIFRSDQAFHGKMHLQNADGDPQASLEVIRLDALSPGEMAHPLRWEGALAPGTYYLIWGAAGYGSETLTFSIPEANPIASDQSSPRQPELSQVYQAAGGVFFNLPADWVHQPLETRGYPEDWPVQESVIFFPRAWADRFQHTGPPDPSAPPAVPPLTLEIFKGDAEQFRRVYVEPVKQSILTSSTLEIKREAAGEERFQQIRYILADPNDPERRLVLTDNLNGFPERAVENPEISQIIPVIISSLHCE